MLARRLSGVVPIPWTVDAFDSSGDQRCFLVFTGDLWPRTA
jgi:hypothetical protein